MLAWLEPPPDTVIDEIVKQAMATQRSRGLDAQGSIREMVHLLVAELNGQLAAKYRRQAEHATPPTEAEQRSARLATWKHLNGVAR